MFYVMNKDTKLLSYYWDDFQSSFRLKNIIADNVPNYIWENIIIWIDSRIAEDKRENVHDIISSLGFPDCYGVLDVSHGLSLTDTLWIKTDETEHLKWADINHYDKPLNDAIADAAISGLKDGVKIPATYSPEFSTNGSLAKCWVKDDNGDTYLIKGGTKDGDNYGNEPYNELMSSEILSALGYNHVEYTVDTFKGEVVSKCKNMTDKNTSYIPMYDYYTCTGIEDFRRFCTNVCIEDEINKMLVFDFISCNNDRYCDKYGVLVDADTLALKSFAPIFDNGKALTMLSNKSNNLKSDSPCLCTSLDDMARMAKCRLGDKHNIERLVGFKFKTIHDTEYSKDSIKSIEEAIQERVLLFLSW